MTGVPLNISLQQIMLHLFNFTILFGALYILLYKPVKDFMAKRTAHYAEMDSKAEDELKAAEASRRECDDRLKALDDEIREERNSARKDIETKRDAQLAEAKTEAETIIANARAEAERQKEEIIASAQKDIASMVEDAIDKLALDKNEAEAFDAFLDTAEGAGAGSSKGSDK